MQAQMVVELQRLWAEKHRVKKTDMAAVKKTLSGLRETHEQICHQINDLYESFALGEIGKPEYLSEKADVVKQRDAIAARMAELKATLENAGTDGGLQNGFVDAFGKYTEVEEITSEIIAEVLKEVYIYPDGRLEIVWNFRDELEKLKLDLQGDDEDGK